MSEVNASIYISIEAEDMFLTAHRVQFGISTFCNAVACWCLYKQAPEMQSEIKFYLYYMQESRVPNSKQNICVEVLVLLNDLLYDVLVEPFTLMPIYGGYCKGIVCQWLDTRNSLLLAFFLLFSMAFCMLSCILCRHQAIVTGRFKFGKTTNHAIRVAFFAQCCVPSLYGLFAGFDDSESESLVDKFGLSWMRDRGLYVVYKRTPEITVVLPALLLTAMLLKNIISIVMVAHIMWHIRNGTQRSDKNAKRLKHALHILSIQVGLPLAFISLPAIVYIRCLMDNSSLSFGVCYSCVNLINTHSIFHSVILLAITPAYRQAFCTHFARFIAAFFRKIFCGKRKQEQQVTVCRPHSLCRHPGPERTPSNKSAVPSQKSA